MTRRSILSLLASVPFVGRLVAEPSFETLAAKLHEHGYRITAKHALETVPLILRAGFEPLAYRERKSSGVKLWTDDVEGFAFFHLWGDLPDKPGYGNVLGFEIDKKELATADGQKLIDALLNNA